MVEAAQAKVIALSFSVNTILWSGIYVSRVTALASIVIFILSPVREARGAAPLVKLYKAGVRAMSDYDKNAFLSCAWALEAEVVVPGVSGSETSMVRSVAGWRCAGRRFPPWRPRRCPMRPCPA